MADPFSSAVGVIQLVGFALGGTKILYQTIESFRNSSKAIKSLKEELELLGKVLESLKSIVDKPDTNFTPLELPLKRCGEACRDFEKLVLSIAPKGAEDRRTYRGWFRLQYMGEDIKSFKETLGVYRSIVCIAIGDANLRTLVVTNQVLKEYKQMIANTTDQLEERLERLDENIDSLPPQRRPGSSGDAIDSRPMIQERDNTKQCLEICAQVSMHIARVQPNVFENISTPADTDQAPVTTLIGLISARQATNEALRACENILSRTSSRLQRHRNDVDSELQSLASGSSVAPSQAGSEQGVFEAEVESTKQALAYMAKKAKDANSPSINVYENIELADDSHTVLVSTIGQLISAKYISAGARSTHWMGQMSDETVQGLTRTLPQRNFLRNPEAEPRAANTQFEGRYGAGIRLNSQDPTGTGSSPPRGY